MKTIILLLTMLATLYGAHIDDFAKEMQYHRDYNSALSEAKKENKLIMMVMVSDYCPWCRKMERKTLKAASVDKKVKSDFVAMIVDRNHDKAHYPKQFDVPRIPTVFFINPHTQEHLYEAIAYATKSSYLKTLDDVLKMYEEAK